ncbi:putative bifunctional diguanylate cyclase/phosphodiesterase [Cryobacterium fucosi]|uniref:EAL domain-containing protein n=1 Tax=Cryobacterium fucosi TaxID=1259157 RepID=A0A4R9B4S9_9MICO|nr:EAL domain-containing protein [Cryobacterium fucosi]TFD75936.1 EAL domain-containing protein [Cryobacterium fucosi]
MGLSLGMYLGGLLLHGDAGFDPLVDGWLGTITRWLTVAVCWIAVVRTRFRRLSVLLAATAVAVYAVSSSYFYLVQSEGEELPFPSVADAGFLSFYPLILTALAILVRRQLRGLALSVILDGAVGALGVAAVLAVALHPILDAAVGAPPSPATVVALAYPMSDLLLGAVVVGIAAAPGLVVGRRWFLLVGGLLVFAAADVVYALRVSRGVYAIGTPLDAAWAVGLALVALWIDGVARPGASQSGTVTKAGALAVPTAAMAAAAGVLILGSLMDVSALAVVLAALTLVVAVVRTQLAFRQLVRMADLRRLARTDELTGLPNRRALYADVSARLMAGPGRAGALLLLDLDRFKEVNDSLGHDVGDRLLVRVGRRLARQLRSGDLLARLGGDEFAIFLDDADRGQALAVAVKLRAALAEPFTLEGIALQTDVSIGIALCPDQGRDLTVLMRKADMAMYKAKAARSGHKVYDSTDDSHGDTRLRTLQELRVALREDQLILHYQPKIDLATERVTGVEALVRWSHPVRGLLYPDKFLVLVEEAGLMRDLTRVVLEKALDQAAIWRAHQDPLTVAVNLSVSSLIDAELPDRVAAMILSRGLSTSVLILEITEEVVLDDFPRARSILARLRDMGIRIAIDDFGTGYSSLAYLRDLPVDELKLDQSFVLPMAGDPRAAALVASSIHLAHSLGLRMVAEGVEDGVACAELARYGCDEAQGYFIARPVPAAELDVWLAERRLSGSVLSPARS